MEVDIHRIAKALGVTARTAYGRAAREGWPYRMSAVREARGDQPHSYARRARTRHRLYPVEALAVLPSLEGSPRWQALDACLRSLLAGPVDTRAAIKHAKEASAG